MKKGFTLVELLAIIVILGIIGLIGVSVYNNVQKKASNKLYEEQLNEIENRIRSYVLENEGKTLNIEGNNIKLDIYKENTTINIPISFLITEGVLEKYPINPKCGKKIEGYYTLKVTVPGTYILEYHMSNSEETFCKV